MEYHEAVETLQSLQRRRPKLGVETTARMLAHLGDPQSEMAVVQVAGSNGKGSTARLLERVLRADGLAVGVFTSPALRDVRDQIRVDGRPVPKSRVAAFVETMEPCLDRLRADDDEPTHFEVITALALSHFGAEDVDVAVLEVGIGGRYDATSATDPVASAVTSVSLEHTDLLGDTVAEIARDKAQVAPADAPLVTGATGPALEAIREETAVVNVGPGDAVVDADGGTVEQPTAETENPAPPDVLAVENGMASDVESHVAITGPDWSLETRLSLLGQHQATNAGVAATLARQVADVDPETIAAGLRGAHWPGRFETVETGPRVVLDGSHNPGAAATLGELLERFEYDDLHVVFGAMADKDHHGMVAELPAVETAVVTRPDSDRAADTEPLAAVFEGHANRVRQVESVAEATERALGSADERDFVLVTGSLYVVSEARERWTRHVVPKDGASGGQPRSTLAGARFPASSADEVTPRVFETVLRPDQAARVAERLRAVGGECTRSSAGAPGDLVATMLTGTTSQFRAVASALESTGLGLAHLGAQLEAALDGHTRSDPFDAERTALMGILNVTPDSFYDGGEFDERDAAVERATQLVATGADVVDVGGESTRPGADPVPVSDEIDRVVPVVEALSDLPVPLSVDTRKAAVADAALEAGASIVNDVSGLSDPEMRFVVADHDASLVLMHSLSAPVDPDRNVTYDDVVEDVRRDLSEQVMRAERAGIDRDRIVVDPGCGFGKDGAESFELVDRLAEFQSLGCPVMVGHSRKSMFDHVGCASGERLPPTLAVTARAAARGADVVRVHDVEANAAVLRTIAAMDES